MTIKHLFPPSNPTLDLNFAATRELDRLITFTRASTGTYVDSRGRVQTAADDEARFDHDGGTGESLGLLIEESRTNYIQNSTDFNAGDWSFVTAGTSPGAPVCTSNSGTAPDGTNTATRLVCDTGGGTTNGDLCYLRCNRDSTTRQAVSMWIKSNTGSDQTIFMTAQPQPIIATNTWRRILSLSNDFRVGARGDRSEQNVDILIWGAQVEDGDDTTGFHTSYIPTSGGAATRATDVASITGNNFSSWFNPNEGTMFADVGPSLRPGDAVYIQGSTTNPRLSLDADLRFQANGVGGKVNIAHVGVIDGAPMKLAWAVKQGDYAFAVRGSNLTSSDDITVPIVTQMSIGQNIYFGGTDRLNGCVARLSYYPRRLTDEQLEALTA